MNYSVYKTKKDATKKENLSNTIKMFLQNAEDIKKDYETFNIKNFGRLLEVEAYYHEVDEYYKCVGIEVEIETQFAFGEEENKRVTDLETKVGFYSLWIGKSHPVAPFTFEESYRPLGEAHRFDNGLGDYAEVMGEIASVEEVQQHAKLIGYK